jgi:ribosomal protein S18 acetylase RimI-like enzyme
VAYCWVDRQKDGAAVIQSVAVETRRHRRGLGMKILKDTVDILRELDTICIHAFCPSVDDRAKKFLTKLGFRATGLNPDFYCPGEGAVRMTLNVSRD